MKNYVILGISVLSGLIAFGLAFRSFKEREKDLGLKGRKIHVLVAKRTIDAGETLSGNNCGIKTMFASSFTKVGGKYQVVTFQGDSKERAKAAHALFAKGYTLSQDLDKLEPIRWRHFDIGTRTRRRTFADKVAKKSRALALPVDSTGSVSNLIQTNDVVDVIATFQFPQDRADQTLATVTMTLLQHVRVLATGQNHTPFANARGRGYSNITVSVSPKEAELLIFAMQKGKLHFTLRNPADVYIEDDTQRVEFKYLKQNVEKYLKEREQNLNRGLLR